MSIEAMKQALEAIQDLRGYRPDIDKAIEALRTAIQQAEAQQPAQAVNEKHFADFELLVVTTAYEQGFGHAFRTELSNPYAPATNAYKAWDMGRSAGKRNGQPQQPATGEPVAWMASYVDPVGNDHVYVTSHRDLAVENDMHGEPKPLYTHPAPQTSDAYPDS